MQSGAIVSEMAAEIGWMAGLEEEGKERRWIGMSGSCDVQRCFIRGCSRGRSSEGVLL